MAGYSPPMRGPDTLKARMSQAASAFIAGVLIASPSCSLANPVPGGGWADSIAGLFGTEFGDANSANLLNRIFGPLFPAESGSVDATTVSVLVGQLNAAILVIGGLLFAWNLTVGVLQSAHEGVVLGRRWSSLWAPLRVVFALALLVPVPGLGGYNSIQAGVAWIVKGSTLIASELWGRSASLLVTGELPLVEGSTRFDGEILRSVYHNQLCVWLANHQFEAAGSDLRVRFEPVESRGPLRIASSIEGRQPEVCGHYEIPAVPDHIGSRNSDAISGVEAEFRNLHAGILEIAIEGANRAISRQWPAVIAGDRAIPDISGDIAGTLARINDRLREGNRGLIAQIAGGDGERNAARRAIESFMTGGCSNSRQAPDGQRQCGGEGWLGAGNWHMTLARLNSELMGVSSASISAGGPAYSSRDLGWLNRQVVAEADSQGWFARLFSATDPNKYMHVDEAQRIWSAADSGLRDAMLKLAPLGTSLNGSIIENAAPDSPTGLLGRIWRVGFADELETLVSLLSPSGFGQDPIVGLINMGNWFLDVAGILIFGGATVSLLSGGLGTTVVFLIAAPMAAIGVTQSFIIPMLPFVYWILGVAGYFLLVAEAVVAATLWALMHFRLDGEGISGEAGRSGWLMLLALVLTPSLMILGYLAGMVIFRVAAGLLDLGMHYAMGALVNASPVVGIFGLIAAGFLVVISHLVIIERSFSLVSEFPDRILKWIGAASGAGDASSERQFRGVSQTVSSAFSTAARHAGRLSAGGAATKAAQNLPRG